MANRLLGVLAVLAAIGVGFVATSVVLVATQSGEEYEGQSLGDRWASIFGLDDDPPGSVRNDVMLKEEENDDGEMRDSAPSAGDEMVDFLALLIEDGEVSYEELEELAERLSDTPEVFVFRDFDSFEEWSGTSSVENPFIDNRFEWERGRRGEWDEEKTDPHPMKGDDDEQFKRGRGDKPGFEGAGDEYRAFPHEYFGGGDAEWLEKFLEEELMKDGELSEWLGEMKESWESGESEFFMERRFEFEDRDPLEWLEEFWGEDWIEDEMFRDWLEGMPEGGLRELPGGNSFEFNSDDGRFRFRGEWRWTDSEDNPPSNPSYAEDDEEEENRSESFSFGGSI